MTALDETTGNFAHERDSLVLYRLCCSLQVKMESQRIAKAHVTEWPNSLGSDHCHTTRIQPA